MRARRCWAQSIASLLLLFIAAALVTVYLPVELDSPAFYNGDGDDAGGRREPIAVWLDLASTSVYSPLVRAAYTYPTLSAPPTGERRDPVPRRLASRAPPA